MALITAAMNGNCSTMRRQ